MGTKLGQEKLKTLSRVEFMGKYKVFEEIIYRDSENKRQLARICGYYPDGAIMISDLKTKALLKISVEKIEGKLEF